MSSRPGFDEPLKNRILQRDLWICAYCGDDAECVDHVVPYSWSKCNDEYNLVASCNRCNLIASDKVFKDFNAKSKYIRERRAGKRIHHDKIEYAICMTCNEPFSPRQNGSTAFICDKCSKFDQMTQEQRIEYWAENPECRIF